VIAHSSLPSAATATTTATTDYEQTHHSQPQHHQQQHQPQPRLAFSLAKFIPLLSERIYVISPFTRSHLVSWIMVLDSVPDLELVSYLPEFLDGLL
jgi:vacuole morphology and inheritance protein 14